MCAIAHGNDFGYALQLVRFSKGRTGLGGAALSMATDRPGGFGDAEIEETARILPALSLVQRATDLPSLGNFFNPTSLP
jgi:hypothetical protein